ncbi:hypothetical protein BH11PSE4_BH11PSE4_05410 [soil metagenome]
MRSLLALPLLLACAGACQAAEIRAGATMQVKAGSIWFQDAVQFAQWRALKISGDAAALASYQDDILKRRDAWQFLNPLDVRIQGYQPTAHRVDVQITSDGRMQGSKWVVDADALGP